MVVLLLPPSPLATSIKLRTLKSFPCSSLPLSSSSSMDPEIRRSRFTEFPYLSVPHRDLMLHLVSTMETSLNSDLLPSSLPPDVQFYHNEAGTSQGTLHIRSGRHHSLVDFMLGSWLHCETPSGSLDITTLTAYLNSKTDAPRFLMEFLQSSPTSMILILDLPPRKDMVVHADYLEAFYVDTQLDKLRQRLEKVPEVRPYFPSSLYIRCALSPAAVSVVISCDAGDHGRFQEIMRDVVAPVAREMLDIWLNKCARGGTELSESEMEVLEKRDRLIKKSTVEIDLGSSMPRLFGDDVANRVIGAIKEAFKV